MASSLSKFAAQALLLGARVFVRGTTSGLLDVENDDTVLFVTLSQGETMQQSRQFAPGSSWTIEIPSEGFEPAPAVALGLLVTPVIAPPFGAAPGGYHTFTWSDAIVLTTETLGAPPPPG